MIILLFVALGCVNVCQGQKIFFGSEPESGIFECSSTDGGSGSCTLESECSHPGSSPKLCGLRNSLRVICCPDVDPSVRIGEVASPSLSFECGIIPIPEAPVFSLPEFINRKKRNSFSTHSTPISDTSDFEIIDYDYKFEVAGGEESEPNSWPWMALLGTKEKNDIRWFCDGSLINQKWILTAAHCLTNNFDSIARLGEHDQNQIFNDNRRDYSVIEKVISPLYTSIGYHDVGLVKINPIVHFVPRISPVCLPWGEKAKQKILNDGVTLTGWGTEEFGGKPSKVLREAQVTIFDPSVCEESYSKLLSFRRQFPEGMTSENIICAGHPEGGVDACQGDSGGPIVHGEFPQVFGKPPVYTVVGIVSKGHGCGLEDFPGLYAPVASYLQWIKDVAFV